MYIFIKIKCDITFVDFEYFLNKNSKFKFISIINYDLTSQHMSQIKSNNNSESVMYHLTPNDRKIVFKSTIRKITKPHSQNTNQPPIFRSVRIFEYRKKSQKNNSSLLKHTTSGQNFVIPQWSSLKIIVWEPCTA